MAYEDVYLVSDKLRAANDSDVNEIEAAFRTRFPEGYADALLMAFVGVSSRYIYVPSLAGGLVTVRIPRQSRTRPPQGTRNILYPQCVTGSR